MCVIALLAFLQHDKNHRHAWCENKYWSSLAEGQRIQVGWLLFFQRMQGGYFDFKSVRGFACVLHFVMARVLWKSPSGFNNRVTSFVIQCMIRIISSTMVRSDSSKVFYISCPPVLPEARCTGWRTLWPRWGWLPLLSPPRSLPQPFGRICHCIAYCRVEKLT